MERAWFEASVRSKLLYLNLGFQVHNAGFYRIFSEVFSTNYFKCRASVVPCCTSLRSFVRLDQGFGVKSVFGLCWLRGAVHSTKTVPSL